LTARSSTWISGIRAHEGKEMTEKRIGQSGGERERGGEGKGG